MVKLFVILAKRYAITNFWLSLKIVLMFVTISDNEKECQ